jgi:urocanate reductase
MKTFFFICTVTLTACASVGSENRISCFEGVGQGFHGPIHVAVYADEDGVKSIEILAHTEDEFAGEPAMYALVDAVLAANSTDVDVVSGATASSRGFLDAMDDALERFNTLRR